MRLDFAMRGEPASSRGAVPPCHIGWVDQFRLRTATLVVAAALIGLGVGLATGLFESRTTSPPRRDRRGRALRAVDPVDPEASEGEDPGDAAGEPDLPPTEDDPEGLSPGPSGPAPSSRRRAGRC